MRSLQGERVVVTGGSRGLGRAIVEALLPTGAEVMALARDGAALAEVERLGASIRIGDATDAALMDSLVAEVQPTALILNAGATPVMGSLDQQTWDSFSTVWSTDVKAGLHGVQAALKAPLPSGSRVLIASSGSALVGSPLSGGYAGAKRQLWFMAHDANAIAQERGLGIQFQALVPLQMVGDTDLIQTVAGEYARRLGVSIAEFRSERNGVEPMSAEAYAQLVVTLLTDERYATGVAYGFRIDTCITSLDGGPSA
jgi:NAD(P)-dependent dehydrogenase (short-subunit alcohol dehydrogenase family)